MNHSTTQGASEIFGLLIKTSQYNQFFIQFYLDNLIINKMLELSQITDDNTLYSVIHTIQLLITLTKTTTLCPQTYQGKPSYESAIELPKSVISMILGNQFSLTYNMMHSTNQNLILDLIIIFQHINDENLVTKILKYAFSHQGESLMGYKNARKILSILLLDGKCIPVSIIRTFFTLQLMARRIIIYLICLSH